MNLWTMIAGSLLLVARPATPADVDWPVNGGAYNIRYSQLSQVNRENVARLTVAWTHDSHDAFKDSEMQSNPIDGWRAGTPGQH